MLESLVSKYVWTNSYNLYTMCTFILCIIGWNYVNELYTEGQTGQKTSQTNKDTKKIIKSLSRNSCYRLNVTKENVKIHPNKIRILICLHHHSILFLVCFNVKEMIFIDGLKQKTLQGAVGCDIKLCTTIVITLIFSFCSL